MNLNFWFCILLLFLSIRLTAQPAETINKNNSVESQKSFKWGINADLLHFQNKHSAQPTRSNQMGLALNLSFFPHANYLFNSKIQITNDGPEYHEGGTTQNGSLQVIYAYLEHHLLTGDLELFFRLGNQLLPLGLSNTHAELIYEYSVQPPDLETYLIPYQWNENGVLFIAHTPNYSLQLGAFNSLDGNKFDTNKPTRNFLNDGLQNGQNAKSEDIMGVARIDVSYDGNYVGGSVAYGDTAQDSQLYEKLTVTIGEVHAQLKFGGISLRAMWVMAKLAEAYKLIGPSFFDQASGYYATLAYDPLFSELSPKGVSLPLFIRYSEYDLHEKVPIFGTKDLSLDRQRITIGLNYRIHDHIVYKFNYQMRKNALSKESDLSEFSVSFKF
ncbi:MAG: hypothetical protein KDD58_07080 [Bdellovibrionales bacterium]|nr:hypothetical protein [Bdellovibrionales bacterium]